MIDARFDDLTDAGTSFRLTDPVGILEAKRPDEVGPALEAAEAAALRGLWVAGFVAYEAAPGLDPALAVRSRDRDDPFARLPLAWFAMFEHREETRLPESQEEPEPSAEPGNTWVASIDRDRYDAAIARIRSCIAAGETYQVNHTLRLRSRVTGDERGLYRDLCYAQRGAYSAYLNLGRYRVLSASPELFFRRDEDRITSRPMKGTSSRGRWNAEDDEIAARLRGSVKDRAENAMIVDLLRNDLGRIAAPGTVSWSDVFDLERFETVWQLTSTVSAQVPVATGLAQIFGALFPCGSVTGAPKVRTMELIAELEDSPRGVYCGAVGYLAPPGPGDLTPPARFNVAIRTVVVDAETGSAEYGVGGGITWDSRAAGEYEETVAKARVLTTRRPHLELLETMLREPDGRIRHLDRHLARIAGSAAYFGFDWDEGAVRHALTSGEVPVSGRTARVRLTVNRRGRPSVTVSPMPPPADAPVRLAVDTHEPVDPSDPFLFHKTTRRGRYERARQRHPDADDVLLTNTDGAVTESTIANVAVLLDGRWLTPRLEDGLLPGVGRELLLDEGELSEATVRIEDLWRADGIVLLSSVRGRRDAELIEPAPRIPRGGQLD